MFQSRFIKMLMHEQRLSDCSSNGAYLCFVSIAECYLKFLNQYYVKLSEAAPSALEDVSSFWAAQAQQG